MDICELIVTVLDVLEMATKLDLVGRFCLMFGIWIWRFVCDQELFVTIISQKP